MNPLL
jgi:hypothetical protein